MLAPLLGRHNVQIPAVEHLVDVFVQFVGADGGKGSAEVGEGQLAKFLVAADEIENEDAFWEDKGNVRVGFNLERNYDG